MMSPSLPTSAIREAATEVVRTSRPDAAKPNEFQTKSCVRPRAVGAQQISWVCRATIPVLIFVAVGAAGCSGGDGQVDQTNQSTAVQPTVTASSSVRQVSAQVDGRTLEGHCSGTEQDLPPVLLDSGMVGGQQELAKLEEQLVQRTVVCAYDRAGVGNSDPPSRSPRQLSDLVAELDAFAAATQVHAPYVLVGQSAGATVVFRYAQAHPDKVAGFVSMNPVPPAKTYLAAVRKVETKPEYQDELSFLH
jgi:pimeloyl-ACP methyl ester carboxylesterase